MLKRDPTRSHDFLLAVYKRERIADMRKDANILWHRHRYLRHVLGEASDEDKFALEQDGDLEGELAWIEDIEAENGLCRALECVFEM